MDWDKALRFLKDTRKSRWKTILVTVPTSHHNIEDKDKFPKEQKEIRNTTCQNLEGTWFITTNKHLPVPKGADNLTVTNKRAATPNVLENLRNHNVKEKQVVRNKWEYFVITLFSTVYRRRRHFDIPKLAATLRRPNKEDLTNLK